MPAYTLVVEDRFGSMTDEYAFDTGRLVAGRSRECDIVLPSENVSRRHAKVFTDSGQLYIEDLGSSNGIYVNGNRIEGPTELSEQSVVRLGDFHLHVKGSRSVGAEKVVYARLLGRNLCVADEIFELSRTTTLVGRGKDAGITLVDPSVSRVHGRLMVKPDGNILVEDVGSANGVFVNDNRAKVWQLSEGDVVRFGNVEFMVEIPTADTMETLAASLTFMGRLGVAIRSNLPWTIASLCTLTVIVLLVLFLPGHLDRESTDQVPPVEPAVEKPVPVPAPAPVAEASPSLEEIRGLIHEKRIDEAARAVAAFLKASPTNVDAVKLSNRITMERRAEQSLGAAMEAAGSKDHTAAAQALLKVPRDSIFREQCVALLGELRDRIDKSRKRTCRRKGRKSVDCIRLTALVAKIESTIKPAETPPPPPPGTPPAAT